MKNRISIVVLLLLLVSNLSFAQAKSMTVRIPFEFHAGSTHMPAGNYAVATISANSVSLRNLETRAAIVLVTDGIERLEPAPVGKLVFNRYGESHFLSQVWTQGFETGRVIHPTKAESQLARKSTRKSTIVLASR